MSSWESEHQKNSRKISAVYKLTYGMEPERIRNIFHDFLGSCKYDLLKEGKIDIDQFLTNLTNSIGFYP